MKKNDVREKTGYECTTAFGIDGELKHFEQGCTEETMAIHTEILLDKAFRLKESTSQSSRPTASFRRLRIPNRRRDRHNRSASAPKAAVVRSTPRPSPQSFRARFRAPDRNRPPSPAPPARSRAPARAFSSDTRLSTRTRTRARRPRALETTLRRRRLAPSPPPSSRTSSGTPLASSVASTSSRPRVPDASPARLGTRAPSFARSARRRQYAPLNFF